MIISNELFQAICDLDAYESRRIAFILKTKLGDIILTGFPLSDSFVIGYCKGINLIIKLLICNPNAKDYLFKRINSLDLNYYLKNSCKSCFNDGFIQAFNNLNKEIEYFHLKHIKTNNLE